MFIFPTIYTNLLLAKGTLKTRCVGLVGKTYQFPKWAGGGGISISDKNIDPCRIQIRICVVRIRRPRRLTQELEAHLGAEGSYWSHEGSSGDLEAHNGAMEAHPGAV
jgi:hypothetical protein